MTVDRVLTQIGATAAGSNPNGKSALRIVENAFRLTVPAN